MHMNNMVSQIIVLIGRLSNNIIFHSFEPREN